MFGPKRILVPTDFSGYSDSAISNAVDLASKYNAEIVLLHVVDDNIQQCAVDYCIKNEDIELMINQRMKSSEEKLNKTIDQIKGLKKVDISFKIKRGAPGKVILDEVKNGVDLIVITSHGKTGIIKDLMGSVADKIVKSAKCPVMVFHA